MQGGKVILCSEEKTFTLSTVDNMRICKMEENRRFNNGKENKTDSSQILRNLRTEIGEEAFKEWGLGVVTAFQQKEILQHEVFFQEGNSQNKQPKMDDSALSRSENNSIWLLRDMREKECNGCSSQGWKLEEQLARKLDAYLQELSYQGTQGKEILQDLWQASEGIGVLREALSKVQKIWEPTGIQDQSTLGNNIRNTIVRRLTPVEAERLQGFPDNYTNIPWKGRSSSPDGRRYKALGNSMAVPVMQWIGKRIEAAEPVERDERAIERALYVTPVDDEDQLSLF